MSFSIITIIVRREQVRKPTNYSDPALSNSTDCLGVHSYRYNDKDNVKFKDMTKDRDKYNYKDGDKYKDKDKDNANERDKKNDRDGENYRDKNEDEE